jgi:AhpD family alkylhydroperoxidase
MTPAHATIRPSPATIGKPIVTAARRTGADLHQGMPPRREYRRGFTSLPEEVAMEHPMYPESGAEIARKRHELAPGPLEAFQNFSSAVFADGTLPSVTKQLIAVAVAHTTQCPYCIKGHTRAALKAGATEQQIMEAIWVAAEMRAGGAYAHSALAIDTMQQHAHAG